MAQQPTRSGETQYDTRLFNQSEGKASGFGGEDQEIYDTQLFSQQSQNVYQFDKTRSQKNMAGYVDRPGDENKDEMKQGESRNVPLEFEEDEIRGGNESDPFGLDRMAKRFKKG